MRTREFVVELVPRAIGLVGNLEYLAVRLDAVDAHAADANDQIFVLVELHAIRPAADMGKHFAVFEDSAGKTDDVAVAGTAVNPVLPVEDHVFGTLNLVQADRFRAEQSVVLRERRAAVGRSEGAATSGTCAGLT